MPRLEKPRRLPGRRHVGRVADVIRVVLADDQVLVRTGFRALLESEPDITVVGEAGEGAGAVALARQERPDVVLMDIRMPGVDGLTAAKADRRRPAPGRGQGAGADDVRARRVRVRSAARRGAAGSW